MILRWLAINFVAGQPTLPLPLTYPPAEIGPYKALISGEGVSFWAAIICLN